METDPGNESRFPAGLRVLVVDDDRICLLILDRLLRECLYRVTTCERAADALKLLRDNKDGFDVVISDVHMPDMDGYKLLELVGLEMDLPVLMMSSNSETSAVMKGIKHGACDYLLKPVRIEELRNIWQHVIRRKQKELECEDHHKPDDSADPLANDGAHADGASKMSKKRKDNLEEDDDVEPENDDPATSKKPRVVWSVDLHQKFVNAVNTLGIDKAVPKRILELMDVKGLTRENVASHLQKYRLYLKRISGVSYQGCGGVGSSLFGCGDERFWPTGAGLMGDYHSQLPAHSLIPSLHSGLFDRVVPNSIDPVFLSQLGTIQGIGTVLSAKPPFAVPLLNSASDLTHPMTRSMGAHGPSDKLYNSPLAAQTERHFGQERNMPTDYKNSRLLGHILQQQCIGAQMALPDIERTNLQQVESRTPLIHDSLNSMNSSCTTGREIATLSNLSYEPPSTMLGPFRKKSMELKSENNVLDPELIRYNALSGLVSQPILNAIELSSQDRFVGLQSVLPDKVGGNSYRFGTGLLTNCKGWNQDHNLASQADVSLGVSDYNQVSTPCRASKSSFVPESLTGWMPNFQCEPVGAFDVKPLATSMMPALEQDLGVREVMKIASLDSLVASKISSIVPETFASADDLLTSYIKQQHGINSAAEGNAEDGYTQPTCM